MPHDEIILVPGFLGFQKVWSLPYFQEVEAVVERPFADEGREVRVRAIKTSPTSSLGQRAARLAEAVAATSPEARIHLIGHSTGGLDARLFVAPGVTLPTTVDVEAAAARVESVVSVATPHHGTPLATYMTGVHGHRLLRLTAVVMTQLLRMGRGLPEVSKAVLLLGSLSGLDPRYAGGLSRELEETLDELDNDDGSVHALIEEMGQDTALLEQLTPASLELFNNATQNRPSTRYGCVVAAPPPPSLRRRWLVGVDPVGQATYALYTTLHRLTGVLQTRSRAGLSEAQVERLRADLGEVPSPTDNDAFVPSLSQAWGDVIAGVSCDHLDLMGYYGGSALDLLASGSPFGKAEFEAVWTAVARFSVGV